MCKRYKRPTFQTYQTKPNLPNQTFQTKPTRPALLNQTYQPRKINMDLFPVFVTIGIKMTEEEGGGGK